MKTKKNNILIGLLIYAIISLIIGSFFDLQISKALYLRGNIIPNTFKFLGEFPMIIILATACFALIRNLKEKKYLPLKILMLIVAVGFSFGSSLTTLKYFGYKNILVSLFIFVFYLSVAFVLSSDIKIESRKKLINYCLFAISSIVIIFLAFTILKEIFGRTRFFAMHINMDYSRFTNWWVITGNGGNDIYKSFPSGHSGAAAASLVLIFIPELFKENRFISKRKNLFILFPIIWTILVQWSRILDGAHYLSDVSFSLILSICVIFIMKKVFLDKYLDNELKVNKR